jgi:hypothetical protein
MAVIIETAPNYTNTIGNNTVVRGTLKDKVKSTKISHIYVYTLSRCMYREINQMSVTYIITIL